MADLKIARFQLKDGEISYGLLQEDGTFRVLSGDPLGEWEPGDQIVPADAVRLLAPVDPPNVIAIGLNYRSHGEETGIRPPDRPLLFLKATTAVCGPKDPIVLPAMAPDEVDYECELVMVIGKTARNVPEEKALDYVLGYTCGNDVSARDCQIRQDKQWARGKSFDTFAPIGPLIVSGIDPDNLVLQTRLNGRIMQKANTRELLFSCRSLVSYISQCMTLLPGTLIMTGTPEGVGFTRKPPVFLRPGNVVEVEIEGIGVLRNPVVMEKTGF